MSRRELKIDLPPKLAFLVQVPCRYKVARGGRGGTKSWSFARALLSLGIQKSLRILCAREIQNSIKDSVHQLLSDQIDLLKLGAYYRVFNNEIIGKRNDTLFTFTGLQSLTAHTIKSYEGYDICWVEEGQAITDRSWRILIPTIRKDGSEIWVSYNPDLETDATHQRFTIHPPEDCINVLINWPDNPWFNDVLNKERLHCKETDPDNYDNIWEGACKPAVAGAIFFKQVAEMERQGRITHVPYDPLLKVHLVADRGWQDATSVGMVQKHPGGAIRIIDYYEATQQDWNQDTVELKKRNYNWGRFFLPPDGFSRLKESSGKSSADILGKLGWDVVPKEDIVQYALPVEEGIKATRLTFSQFYIDKDKCNPLIECWKRYRRRITQNTEEIGTPVHDIYSHGADMTRYIACNLDLMTNEDERPMVVGRIMDPYKPLDAWVGI